MTWRKIVNERGGGKEMKDCVHISPKIIRISRNLADWLEAERIDIYYDPEEFKLALVKGERYTLQPPQKGQAPFAHWHAAYKQLGIEGVHGRFEAYIGEVKGRKAIIVEGVA